MRKLFILLIILSFAWQVHSQSTPINLDEIRKYSKTEQFQKLLSRFIANDTTLSQFDYIQVYYGYAFQDGYNAYTSHDSAKVLKEYLNSERDTFDFNKIVYYTSLILNKNPLSLDEIYLTALSFEKLGKTEMAKIWYTKYDYLIQSILSSGDGKEPNSAMVVICVSDEYAVLRALGLKFTGQSLESKKTKHYDVMSVAKNEYKLKELYFDIDLFFGKWK